MLFATLSVTTRYSMGNQPRWLLTGVFSAGCEANERRRENKRPEGSIPPAFFVWSSSGRENRLTLQYFLRRNLRFMHAVADSDPFIRAADEM